MADTMSFRVRLSRGAGFDLDVAGEVPLSGVTAIAGPSGGGKTTLLRVLAGLETAADAEVRFGGTVWDGPGAKVPTEARRIGFVFQDTALFPHLTVADNLRYGARRRDVSQYGAIIDALDLEPLLGRVTAGLSGGEARRVALGRALASNPAILFLDEPLSGLDQARKAELLPYIGRAVAEARVPALYVTHSRFEIATLADRVMGIEGGRSTGWQSPPNRLLATVVEARMGVMRVRIDGAPEDAHAELSLTRIAGPGERVGLGLPAESLMVSASHPGRSDALLHLPARVVEGRGGMTLDVFGQRVVLPRGRPQAVGSEVWLSLLDVAPRPEGVDSGDARG